MNSNQQVQTENLDGCIAVDKFGCEVLFLNPAKGAVESKLSGFSKTVHELLLLPERSLAYVPVFGDGIHGNNPNPGHQIAVIDIRERRHLSDIDISPLKAPHTMRLGPDGLIYVTCENSGVVALVDPTDNAVVDTIETGSTNCHRLEISPDQRFLYTENEEDCSISVIDLQVRKLQRQISTPHALGGLAVTADSSIVVAVDDESPALFLVDVEAGKVGSTIALHGLDQPAQIAKFSPDFEMLAVTSMSSDRVVLLDPDFNNQAIMETGHKPMDMAFRGNELYIACQGDGTIHVVDWKRAQPLRYFKAGVGCESIGFF